MPNANFVLNIYLDNETEVDNYERRQQFLSFLGKGKCLEIQCFEHKRSSKNISRLWSLQKVFFVGLFVMPIVCLRIWGSGIDLRVEKEGATWSFSSLLCWI